LRTINRHADTGVRIRISSKPVIRTGRPKSIKIWYGALKSVLRPIIKAKVEIDALGLNNIPESGPAIIVSNHRSGRDPQIISTVVPRYIAWVAANYMSRVPFQGALMRKLGVVFVSTLSGGGAAQFFEQAKKVLSEGDILGVFPEGEDYIFANDFSAPPARFHRGFAALALRNDTPIIPAAIYPVAETLKPIPISNSVRRELRRRHDLSSIRKMPQYQAVRVTFGTPLRPSATDITPDDLADRVRDKVTRLLQKHPSPDYLSAPPSQGEARET
jgi:1-acyl-sn-glycerol-3-phosphate acyltransferase